MRAYERLLKYISFSTTSSEESGTHPSTSSQFELAKALVMELKSLGLTDAAVDEKCYVYASLSATPGYEAAEAIGLISHMDTAPAFKGEGISPRIIDNYDGEDIVLNLEKNIVMETAIFPHLKNYIGKSLIVTDGNTLLGADDKAGIAEIMTMLEKISTDNIPHGPIKIAFTPDEEIGEGADFFDVKKFNAAYAYTVDGGALGEIEYENFNAASAKITIHGNCIHPGEGKNKMKNASLFAMEFNSLLPAFETPAHTENYEGFYHLISMKGDEELAELQYILRDHDMEKFEFRKKFVQEIAAFLNCKYGEGTVEAEVKDSYYNMKEKVAERMDIVEKAVKAMEKNGVEPLIVPIRGGTDGARLSYMGLLCPNLSTGGHNFHGKFEYIPVESMDKMVDVLVTLVEK